MSTARRPSLTTTLTIGVILLAAAIRFWKLGWGLSSAVFFPDEHQLWPTYLFSFIPLEWTSFLRPERAPAFNYPTLFGTLAGLTVAAAHRIGLLIPPWEDFASALYYARAVAATASVVTVGLVAVAGRRMYGASTGLIAALFIALVPLENIQAHYANVDTLLGALITASILLAWVVARTGSTAWAFAAGLVAGLAFGTKYNGLALAALVAWAGLEAAFQRRSLWPLLAIGVASIGGLGIGFATACPACLIQSEHWLQAMSLLSLASNPENLFFWRAELIPTLGWIGRPLVWQAFAALPFVLGWPMYLVAIAGVAAALFRHALKDRLLLILLCVLFFPMGTSVIDAPRYVLPLVPALVLLGARFVVGLPGRWTGVVITTLVCAYTLPLTVSQVSRLNYEQQGEVAHWIRTSLPERTDGKSLQIGFPAQMGPYFRLTRPLRYAGMTPVPLWSDRWFDADIDAFVLPDPHVVLVHRSRPGSDDERVVELLEAGESGFSERLRLSPSYFDQDFYIGLDPSFAGDLLLGELGFRVFVRDAALGPKETGTPPAVGPG